MIPADRLLPIVDVATCGARGIEPTTLLEKLWAQGAQQAIFRAREPRTAALDAQLAQALEQAHGAGARLYLAVELGTGLPAALAGDRVPGVQLQMRQLADAARWRAAGARIGVSVHDELELAAALAAGADHALISPWRAPLSKSSSRAPLGDAGVRALVAGAQGVPLYVLGGVRREDLAAACALGAWGIAGITLAFELAGAK